MNVVRFRISRAFYDAFVFDLDGVVTDTAGVHAKAWKELFDNYLRQISPDGNFTPFDIEGDYLGYVDGKPRYQGVKSFLESRNINLEFGDVDDFPDAETICGLGNRKNQIFTQTLKENGVDVFDSSLDLLFKLRSRGFKTAVVSSSKNCSSILDAANIAQLFDVQVDGIDIEHLDMKGKPDPDSFLEATRMLNVDPCRCALVEDAISGVQAGRRGDFGLVVGIDRADVSEDLEQAGADIVLNDLAELYLDDNLKNLPNGLIYFEEIRQQIKDKQAVVFLDYDGTLTPIVSRPEDAVLSDEMRKVLTALTEKCKVAIISGRGLGDARELVQVEDLYFAGSHGFEIEGPGGMHMEMQEAENMLPVLDSVEQTLQKGLQEIPGALVERKKFSIAVHYRNVDADQVDTLKKVVDRTLKEHPDLRKGLGKKVMELKPSIDWDKGKALNWILDKLDLDQYQVVPIYIGDDTTDEDAFKVLEQKGVSIVVGNESRITSAKYRLESVDEVENFLHMLQVFLRNWRTWSLVYEGYKPSEEGLRESLCTVGNGYFATRGAAPECNADEVHYPGTYLAGGYNRLKSEKAGRLIENEDLVNMPNWIYLNFRFPDEEWFNLDETEILSYRHSLDINNGIMYRTVHFRDNKGRETKIYHRRIVCMQHMHLGALESTIVPVNWSGEVEVCSALDGTVINAGVKRYQSLSSKHLEPVKTEEIDVRTIGLKVRTNQSNIFISQAARTEVFKQRKPVAVERDCVQEPGYIAHKFKVDVEQGSGLSVEKVVSFFTSRDYAISESFLEASNKILEARRFNCLSNRHSITWKHLWRRFAVEVELNVNGDPSVPVSDYDHYYYVQRTMHLYCFHLLQSASLHSMDIDVGMPARGWHGEGYRGHIFWDELLIFPFINYRAPQITQSLLMYRYRRLGQARRMAANKGFKGAMYPWQSGSNGREETQELHLNPKSGRWNPDHSHLQRHVNLAIVYNIWQYCQISGDFEFLSFYGAEMILEIARFFASITIYNEDSGRFEIHGVMGPDEYHDGYPDAKRPGINNNSYTNVMVVFLMNRALELADILPREEWDQLCERLDVRKAEIERWKEISTKMKVVFHGDGIISQFEGYEDLQEFDWEGYKQKYGNIQRLDRILEAEGDSPNYYKASKQADALMLFYLFSAEHLEQLFSQLGYTFKHDIIPKNIDYYLERTSNGSSLSYLVHSWVATRRDRGHSWQLFEEALKTDISDIQGGTTAEGIHLGAMAGCVDIVQRAYTGLEARGNILRFNPAFPEELSEVRFHLRYRGHWLDVEIRAKRIRIEALKGGAEQVQVQVKDQVYDLKPGKTIDCIL